MGWNDRGGGNGNGRTVEGGMGRRTMDEGMWIVDGCMVYIHIYMYIYTVVSVNITL
jgi:hypothetical protein